MRHPPHYFSPLHALLIGLLIVGIVFRFVNLNHKVYWHDEAYTSLRAAGYTRQAIDQTLFQNHVLSAASLQRFQQIKPQSAIADTVRSLIQEDPQHPPLYFLLSRFWVQAMGDFSQVTFHSPITAWRLLPALLSLFALPLMYALAWELFASRTTALLATTLLSLSPFDVLFAQTARQYSLLTVLVIGSQLALLRAIRLGKRQHWGLYGASVVLGLYTHPFFGLTLVGQGVYVGWESWRWRGGPSRSPLIAFGLSVAGAIALYTPWIYVLLTHTQRALDTTNWIAVTPGIDYLLKLWTLSFTSLFFDLDFGFNNPLTYVLRLPLLVLIAVAMYFLVRRGSAAAAWAVITSIVVPFLLLVLPDLVLGGKRSAVSRYLISCFPGVQLAIAHLLATGLTAIRSRTNRPTPTLQPLWRTTFVTLCAASLISLTASAAAFTWWNKDLSYANFAIVQRLNVIPHPIVISDIGDDFTNTGDLISLSYQLKPGVELLLLSADARWVSTPAFQAAIQGKTAIAFRPAQATRQALEQTFGPLQPLIADARLWKIPAP